MGPDKYCAKVSIFAQLFFAVLFTGAIGISAHSQAETRAAIQSREAGIHDPNRAAYSFGSP